MKKLIVILFLYVNICCQVFAEPIDLDSIAKRFAGTGITDEVLEVVDTLTEEILDILMTRKITLVYEGKECVFYYNSWNNYLKRQDGDGNWEYFSKEKTDSIMSIMLSDVIVVPYGKITKHIHPTPDRYNIKSGDSIKTEMPDNCKHEQKKDDKCKVE